MVGDAGYACDAGADSRKPLRRTRVSDPRTRRDAAYAADALQDAFLYIWRVADTYRDSLSPPLAWMGVVVRSRALDLLRRRAAQRTNRTEALDEAVHDTADVEAPTPADLADWSEQAWALHQCLRKLETRQREVLSLAYLRDLSHVDLARQLKLPIGTVKTWIRRGIEQLRGCMARYARVPERGSAPRP